MALEMKGKCEKCFEPLGNVNAIAFICSYECTFCEACIKQLKYICPNCSGELVRRPKRPVKNT